MPRTEPKIVANATALRKKTTAVKLAICLISVSILCIGLGRLAGKAPVLASAAIGKRCGRERALASGKRNLIPFRRQLQQAGGARVDWNSAGAVAGESGRVAATRALMACRKKAAACDSG